MRKIPAEYESPFDDFALNICDNAGILELFHDWRFTPNHITTIGNIFRALSLFWLFRGQKTLFFLGAVAGFFFDCFDGHYARKYNMSTNFGDFYDHISDTVYHVILLYLLFTSSGFRNLSENGQLGVILLLVLVAYGFFMHMGCQEQFFKCNANLDNCSSTLKPFKQLCPDASWIVWTKYLGTGTFVVIVYTLTALLW